MKKNILVFSALSALLMTGCYVDKGNYEYKEVEPITIEGIESSYAVYSYEQILEISPVVKGAPESEMEYKWVLYSSTANDAPENVIGTEKNLKYPVNEAPGQYTIFYEAKHKPTGLTRSTSTSLSCVTRFSRGWYVLKEKSGSTELDMYNNEGTVVGDLLSKAMGNPLEGKPVSLSLMPDYSFIDKSTSSLSSGIRLSLISDKNIWVVNPSAMSLVYDKTDLFFDGTPNCTFYNTARASFGQILLTSEGCYYAQSLPSWGIGGSGKMGMPEGKGGSEHSFYSYGLNALIYFNYDNNSLKGCDYNGYVHDFLSEESNNVPGECLMVDNYYSSLNGEFTYLLMKDNGKIVLYVFDISKKQKYNAPLVIKYEFPAESPIYKATSYATNRGQVRFMYYTVGNHLYALDIENLTEKDVTPEGVSSDNLVYVRHCKWSRGNDKDFTFDYLVLGSQNGDNYSVKMFKMLGGSPDGSAQLHFGGDGKFVDIEYLSPSMNSDLYYYYYY